ncbi:MAG: phosphate ABC transporter permease PstA [Oscillibacter sp.]|nr:phosphate ABC transporter permease PstA [Oscillibacter sp.]
MAEDKTLSPVRKRHDFLLQALLSASGALVCILLFFLTGYLLWRGLPYITWNLLTKEPSMLQGTAGLLPHIASTLYIVVTTLVLVLPLGVGAAVYLTEYAQGSRLAAWVEFAAEILAGVPSIIFGLVGMLFFVQIWGLGTGVLAGSLTLTIMILPTILRTTQESLKTVPNAYREGAMGLGAGKWRAIRTVVLPSAADGILTGCILAVGRMVGESAALLFTAGFGTILYGWWESLTSSSATLSVALYLYANERGDTDTAFAIAAILALLTLAVNLLAKLAGRKLKRSR